MKPALLLFGCLTSVASWAVPPEEIPLALQATRVSIAQVDSYPAAVDAIVRTMVEAFGLPAPRGELLIYRTREDFEAGLVTHLKIKPELARSTAAFAKSAVGAHKVLVNEPAIASTAWPDRLELLAHELAHAVQLTLANKPGLARHQWLIEGSAEWLALNVTAALKQEPMATVRERVLGKVREARRKQPLPGVTEMDSFSQWVAARNRHGFDGTYLLSFLAIDYLVSQHSFPALVGYFRRFEASADHAANFEAAFGESVSAFGGKLAAHLEGVLR